MADTSLILHVKGTEAETAVLPKDVVRAGISEGKITHSQLIWIPGENTWKQVKELPDLLPGESLILHVKGTEAETQQLPKHQVKAGISEGKITHSQLIWIPSENTWKPVRELPDLLPGETLILHVKGTEAETKQLPKQAVQAGVSKGQITHSQLIWIPNTGTFAQPETRAGPFAGDAACDAPHRGRNHPGVARWTGGACHCGIGRHSQGAGGPGRQQRSPSGRGGGSGDASRSRRGQSAQSNSKNRIGGHASGSNRGIIAGARRAKSRRGDRPPCPRRGSVERDSEGSR
jgi:hypothetical protein